MTKKSNKKKNNQFSVLQTDTESDGSVKGATTEPSAIRSDRISPRLSKGGKESPSSKNDNDYLEEVLKGLKDAQDDPKIRAALDDYDRALALAATLSKELADGILQEVKSKMLKIYSVYQDRLAREAQELKELWLLFDAAAKDQAELEAKSKILEEQFVTVYDKAKYISSNSDPVHQEMNEALMDYESAKLSSDLAAIEAQRQHLKKLVDAWQSCPPELQDNDNKPTTYEHDSSAFPAIRSDTPEESAPSVSTTNQAPAVTESPDDKVKSEALSKNSRKMLKKAAAREASNYLLAQTKLLGNSKSSAPEALHDKASPRVSTGIAERTASLKTAATRDATAVRAKQQQIESSVSNTRVRLEVGKIESKLQQKQALSDATAKPKHTEAKAAALNKAEKRAASNKTKKSSDFQVAVQDAQLEDVDLKAEDYEQVKFIPSSVALVPALPHGNIGFLSDLDSLYPDECCQNLQEAALPDSTLFQEAPVVESHPALDALSKNKPVAPSAANPTASALSNTDINKDPEETGTTYVDNRDSKKETSDSVTEMTKSQTGKPKQIVVEIIPIEEEPILPKKESALTLGTYRQLPISLVPKDGSSEDFGSERDDSQGQTDNPSQSATRRPFSTRNRMKLPETVSIRFDELFLPLDSSKDEKSQLSRCERDDINRHIELYVNDSKSRRETVFMVTRTPVQRGTREQQRSSSPTAYSNPLSSIINSAQRAFSRSPPRTVTFSESVRYNSLHQQDDTEEPDDEDSGSSSAQTDSSTIPSSSGATAQSVPTVPLREPIAPISTVLTNSAQTLVTSPVLTFAQMVQEFNTAFGSNPLAALKRPGPAVYPSIPGKLFMSQGQDEGASSIAPPRTTVPTAAPNLSQRTRAQQTEARRNQVEGDEFLALKIAGDDFDRSLGNPPSSSSDTFPVYGTTASSAAADRERKETIELKAKLDQMQKQRDELAALLRKAKNSDPSSTPNEFALCEDSITTPSKDDRKSSKDISGNNRRKTARFDSLPASFQTKFIYVSGKKMKNPYWTPPPGSDPPGDGDDDGDDDDEPPDDSSEPFEYDPHKYPIRNPLWFRVKGTEEYGVDLLHYVPRSQREADADSVLLKQELTKHKRKIQGAPDVRETIDTSFLSFKETRGKTAERYESHVNLQRKEMTSPVSDYRNCSLSMFKLLTMKTYLFMSNDITNKPPGAYDLLSVECQNECVFKLNIINTLSVTTMPHLYDGLVIKGRQESATHLKRQRWDLFFCKLWVVTHMSQTSTIFDLKLANIIKLEMRVLPVMPADVLQLCLRYPSFQLALVSVVTDLNQSVHGINWFAQRHTKIQYSAKHKRAPYGAHNLVMAELESKGVSLMIDHMIERAEYGDERDRSQNQRPVRAESFRKYLNIVLLESEFKSRETASQFMLLSELEEQAKASELFKDKKTKPTTSSRDTVKKSNGKVAEGRPHSDRERKQTVRTDKSTTPSRAANFWVRRSTQPEKVMYMAENTLNNISEWENNLEVLDVAHQPEMMDHLMNINVNARGGTLQSYAGAEKSPSSATKMPVCLLKLHFGNCTRTPTCNFDHSRAAIEEGREAAKKIWAEDIKLHYMDTQFWTTTPTTTTHDSEDESDDEVADEIDEPSESYKAFFGYNSDN